MRIELIEEMVEQFYNHQITLALVVGTLTDEEFAEFVRQYDPYVTNGSHNAP